MGTEYLSLIEAVQSKGDLSDEELLHLIQMPPFSMQEQEMANQPHFFTSEENALFQAADHIRRKY